MTKQKRMLFSAAMLALLVAGCGEEAPKNEVEKSQEEATKEVVEKAVIEIPTQESFMALANQYVQGLVEKLNQAGVDFNIQDGSVTDTMYESMKVNFTPYATTQYIDGDLKEIAKAFCYSGCDFPFFPYDPARAMDVQLEKISDTEVKLVSVFTADMMSPKSFKEAIYFTYEEGLWKLNDVTKEETILNLTADQALQVVKTMGYENPQFVEEKLQKVNGDAAEKVYQFSVTGQHIIITAASGYIEDAGVEVPQAQPSPEPGSKGTIFATYEAKLDKTAAQAQQIVDSFTGYTTAEMNENANEVFAVWDALLNEMYGVLKANLPAAEFEELRADQREWITERDDYAEFRANEEAAGGTMYTSIYVHAQADYTAQRCSDFLWDIMINF